MKKTSLFCLALGLSAALCACGSAATETTPVPETDSAVAERKATIQPEQKMQQRRRKALLQKTQFRPAT